MSRQIVGGHDGVRAHQHASIPAPGMARTSRKVEALATPRHRNMPRSAALSKRLAAWLLATALLAVGCTTSEVLGGRVLGVRDLPPMGIGPQEAIAVLLRQFPGKSSADFLAKEKEIVSCISDSLLKVHPDLQILPPDEVRRVVFPDLSPEETPLSPESLALLLQGPELPGRMARLNVRYLIVLEGNTQQKSAPVIIGGQGAGMIGAAWDRRSRLSAVLVDVRQNSVREVQVTVTGRAWAGIVGGGGEGGGGMGFPIFVPAFTESRACSDLGEALAQWLAEAETIQP